MVREESADSPFVADGPRVGYERSVFRGVLLVVWGLISDGPLQTHGRSARFMWIVHPEPCRLAKPFAS
jgi:hypothetical protein